jgi:hypothetical protein
VILAGRCLRGPKNFEAVKVIRHRQLVLRINRALRTRIAACKPPETGRFCLVGRRVSPPLRCS